MTKWKIIRVRGMVSYTLVDNLPSKEYAEESLAKYIPIANGEEKEYFVVEYNPLVEDESVKRKVIEVNDSIPVGLDDNLEFIYEVDEGKHDGS